MVNAGATPVPVRLRVWGLFEAVSVTVRVPLSAPTTLGVNITLMVHLPLAATLPLQVFVSA